MNILILNWRDIKNPSGGGAEILTHEIGKAWVKRGNRVWQISAKFKGAPSEETIDGVMIKRMGTWWSVHVLAFLYYIKNFRGKIDVIIDEVHLLPFFSILYEPRKTVLLVCEVARKLVFKIFPYPVGFIFSVLENIYFIFYRKVPVLAISHSTREDLISHGFSARNISILPMGLTVPRGLEKFPKESRPTIIYLSRINKQKGIEDAIEAFRIINSQIPSSRLWIVGIGEAEYVSEIKKRIQSLKLTDSVKFFGITSESKKFKLLSKAHLLIFPSIHEGWGLTIAEAGIVGTPSAVYNVAGVRDVVRNGERGIVAETNSPDVLANAIIRYLKNDKLYNNLLLKIKSFEKETGWENTTKTATTAISKYENKKK